MSHDRIISSSDPEASLELAGENVTDRTWSEYSKRVAMRTPDLPCESCTVLVRDPEATLDPSVENARHVHQPEYPSTETMQ